MGIVVRLIPLVVVCLLVFTEPGRRVWTATADWADDRAADWFTDTLEEKNAQRELERRLGGGVKVPATKVGTLLTFEEGSDPHDARIDGRLVFREGCFYVTSSAGTKPKRVPGKVLPIWPQGFTYRGQERRARIMNQDDEPIAKVGDHIVGSGMVTDDRRIAGDVVRERGHLSECDGPYWLMGPVIERRK